MKPRNNSIITPDRRCTQIGNEPVSLAVLFPSRTVSFLAQSGAALSPSWLRPRITGALIYPILPVSVCSACVWRSDESV